MTRGRKTSPEQVVTKLRQIEVQMAQGKSVAQACKEAEISEQSYDRWRKEYGGLQIDQARRMKDLERENARLRRLVAALLVEKQVLKDVERETCKPGATPTGGRWHPAEVRSLGAPHLPSPQPAAWHATLCAGPAC